MSAAVWSVVISGISGALAWCTFVAKLLWNFRGNWDQTNSTLVQLKDQISRLGETDRALEQRLERHLTWHDTHSARW